MELIRGSDAPTRRGGENFSGTAWSRVLAGRDTHAPVRLYEVRFEAGARTHWHVHSGVQVLYVLDGTCQAGVRDGSRVEAGPGDLIRIEPGEEHWHGAGPNGPASHLAINIGFETRWLGREGE